MNINIIWMLLLSPNVIMKASAPRFPGPGAQKPQQPARLPQAPAIDWTTAYIYIYIYIYVHINRLIWDLLKTV